ncbi:MAG: hypothetical protein AVDCRST_MAG51-339 [uncultured Ramlibacter sp.]|uniref:DUF2917 domain-containing protein n=1 Tax=uncultured Ramlibacter sp. TaxID=260755 RepID=A0A6J4NJP1_9BURK|nr:MAG: hypothetical protein AVDCRST_MAG51-339 [uncultured Ramlibacter sp.]
MKVDHTGRFAMVRHTLLEVPQGRVLDVSCGAGTLWLTLDNDPRDIVLAPGQAFRVEPNRRVLVYAMEDSVLEVRASRPPVPAARGWRLPRPAGGWLRSAAPA